jgi:hypothetical protein
MLYLAVYRTNVRGTESVPLFVDGRSYRRVLTKLSRYKSQLKAKPIEF